VLRTNVEDQLLPLGHGEGVRVEGGLRARGVVVLGADHAARVELHLGVAAGGGPELAATVSELTGGAATTAVVGQRWVDSLQS
jgi:hypothetical protein